MSGRGPRLTAASASVLTALALLGGCAHYAPLPLDPVPPLAPALTALPGASNTASYDVAQITALALQNNPDLRAERAKRGIAQAQLLQSGILPNPSVSGAILPLLAGAGSITGWTAGISQNIKAIVTYKSRRRQSGYAAQQVDADILWQEWQVAGQARQLAIDLISAERSRPILAEAFDLLSRRDTVLQQALAARNVTLVAVAPTRVALQGARANLLALDQRELALRHQLNALLGLVPDAVVPLTPTIDLPAFDPAAIRAGLASLPDRRPDLLALRLGYAAEDEGVRQAILSQFPDLIFGAQASSDNAGIINGGPSMTIGLPIFDRNQGNIAIANATRAQLNAAYSARLAAATGQVGAMLSEMEQLQDQLNMVRRDLPAARLAAARAARAFGASNLDERSYVDLVTNRYAKEQEVMTLELSLRDRQVALQTLLGAGLPSVETLPAPYVADAKVPQP
jgi:outer membrane protein TolC